MNFGSLKIYLILTFLSFCRLKTTTTTPETIVTNGTTVMRNSSGASIFLHSRQKRYLLFQKGATVGMQTNFAKALISERPRGLNEITEYTLTYDLPYMLLHRYQPVRTTTTELPYTPEHWHWANDVGSWHEAQRRRYKIPTVTTTTSKLKSKSPPLNCQPMSLHAVMQPKRLYLCSTSNMRPMKQQKRRYKRKIAPESNLLFDLLTLWARIHAYNARHCIMRTLCEVKQALRPTGELLIHDLLRLILLSALPAVEQHAPYANAWQRRNGHTDNCERLYGPHCRLSFLQQLNTALASLQQQQQ